MAMAEDSDHLMPTVASVEARAVVFPGAQTGASSMVAQQARNLAKAEVAKGQTGLPYQEYVGHQQDRQVHHAIQTG